MATLCDKIRMVFPPKPVLTESNLPDQEGKVFIVTGSSGGIGKAVAAMLYGKNSVVYMAARSKAKCEAAIDEIRRKYPSSTGRLEFLHLDLADLSTIKASAETFLARESRLDVLWNNAGVMASPAGSKTVQGYDLQLGTNNLGPFLFTKLLYPLLVSTVAAAVAGSEHASSTRVVWVSSNGAQSAPTPPVDFGNIDYSIRDETPFNKYFRSKAGNIFHARELARRSKEASDGVISVVMEPGLIKPDIGRNVSTAIHVISAPFQGSVEDGASTELFAGLHESITEEHNGAWVASYGRINTDNLRPDLLDDDSAKRFWEWCEEQVKPYV
ncbi:hypothetical protein GGTG_03497 [Gaeumannomyces tritici R3-111a-1]|uniref:Short-chain dehydrogenase n=1 Tax=Gaeumannomyces tritici (strain R3-111a-1) TaxID=644352 RepID=J3NQE0_GAET3|nr:hypothetical protein GGTG_03497 [Gaeumannomyces tritici R3-111a-1]EJT78396.1 hypothetical protein GGTG_03497 [Gaeumannomyces tritici R3-111a-1]